MKKEKIAAERILGVGISIPGITDMEKREITNSHVLNIKALSFQEMEKFFAYPCIFLNINPPLMLERCRGISRRKRKEFLLFVLKQYGRRSFISVMEELYMGVNFDVEKLDI